jgi:hypothetical protein
VFCGLSLAVLLATNTLYIGPMPEEYFYKNEFYDALPQKSKNAILDINVLNAPYNIGAVFWTQKKVF